jgi:hypothetical protein
VGPRIYSRIVFKAKTRNFLCEKCTTRGSVAAATLTRGGRFAAKKDWFMAERSCSYES